MATTPIIHWFLLLHKYNVGPRRSRYTSIIPLRGRQGSEGTTQRRSSKNTSTRSLCLGNTHHKFGKKNKYIAVQGITMKSYSKDVVSLSEGFLMKRRKEKRPEGKKKKR
jgi:hypothetical protein